MSSHLKDLQAVLGHSFQNADLLEEALTHSSVPRARNYQRLEFLGDRVLGLIIAEFLIQNFPDENEGDMARRFSALVDRSMLVTIATEISLGESIQMSEGEKAAGGASNDNILSDVMEAVLAALYLEAGLEKCRDTVITLWGGHLFETVRPPVDPKTELQEWTQGRGLGLPVYELVDREGPDHAPLFDIEVSVDGFEPVRAKGGSRRSAEKNAASLMLEALKKEA